MAHREYGPWFSSQLGGGGYWLDTQPSIVDDRWYVWSDVGGIYRSDDDAATWHALHQHFPDGQGDVTNIRSLLEHRTDPDRLVAFTGTRWREAGGIWTSDDAGQSWTKRLTGRFWGNAEGREFGRTLVSHPTDPAKLVAAGQDGVYRSVDFGQTWTPSTGADGLNPSLIMYDPTDTNRLWLSSWRLDEWSIDGKFDASDGTYESTDGGQTWQKLNNLGVKEVVADPSDPTRWIGSFENDLRESRDGGRTWAPLMNGAPGNNGANWEVNTQHFPALATTSDAVIAANGQGDIYQLPGGASQWQSVQRQHVAAPDWWYGNTGHNDSSDSWVHFGKSASSLRVDPSNQDRWLMTDWYAVWETNDAGQTWSFAADGLENTVLHGVAIDPSDSSHVVVFMGDNGMLSSRDGGQTLDKIHPPGNALYSNVKQAVFAPSDPSVLWAIGNTIPGQWESSAIARSADAGDTLVYASTQGLPAGMSQSNFAAAIAVDPEDPTAAWVAVSGNIGNGGGVYSTTDNGQSWQALTAGLPQGQDVFSSNIWDRGPELAVGSDGTLIAVSKSRRKGYRLDDGSSTWQELGWLPDAPAAIASDPHTPGQWWLATQGKGLFRSDDQGQSWERIFNAGVADVALDPNLPGHLVVGAADGVHASSDGGVTWENVSLDMPHRLYPTVAISNGLIVAGTKGNGVFVRNWPDLADANLPGDFDGDGQVAQGDLNLVLNNWGALEKPAAFLAGLDGLTDPVDQDELNRVLNHWGSAAPPSFEGSPIPEPATAAALGGLGVLSMMRR
ncbi:MAG: hypothetical protein AAF328_10970 [Planctomycetota bacterium]